MSPEVGGCYYRRNDQNGNQMVDLPASLSGHRRILPQLAPSLPDNFVLSMAASASSRQPSSPLLTNAYLGTLAVVLFGICGIVWWLWSSSAFNASSSSFIDAEISDAYESPSDFKPAEDIRLTLDKVTTEQSASRAIHKQLAELERLRSLSCHQ